ncbi:MAG: CoA pyrophosphatase [Bacteroidetes bacterium]|nr:CoA pyrophosphatase [Bacteroidota bacterium]MBK8413337.1 CoA pyrophosphatase [Bacteroidota bacterium]MBK9424844.1 CoA pyrophosphatase [Bacteroidota bacterium]MBL0070640.1 CoA pyrophosphatase [Bacteroidota bacterium]
MTSFESGIDLLAKCMSKPLPGTASQYKMAPSLRKSSAAYLETASNVKSSSVLLLLYPDNNADLATVLIKRPLNSGVHSGQIALPGGKVEPDDINSEATAKRETREEIGVPEHEIKILGALTTLYIPASNFLVSPFIGYVSSPPQFSPDPAEVHQLITLPFNDLIQMPVGESVFETLYGKIAAPCFFLQDHTIWGATAMILSEVRDLIPGEHFGSR